MKALENKVAVVTGASRGIGRAIAIELAEAGAKVVVGYRANEEKAREVVALIEQAGGYAEAIAADVGDEGAVRRLFGLTAQRLGPVDALVCNAGIVRDNLLGAMSTEDWDEVTRVNLRGVFLCVRQALPQMMPRRSGAIVALSSVAATMAGRGHANYASSKGAVESLVRSLAVELAPRSIRVNAVAPGIITTEMTGRIRAYDEKGLLEAIPLGRFGAPEDVAKAVRFLLSPDAAYITGAVLNVTGGLGLGGVNT